MPLDIGERTIFVDIKMNDQTDVGAIAQELDKAEGYYRRAKLHLILGSDGVLDRAWCLYEIAVRREAWKRSQLLFVRAVAANFGVAHVGTTKLSVFGLMHLLFLRNFSFMFSFCILYPLLSICQCTLFGKIYPHFGKRQFKDPLELNSAILKI